MKNVLHLCSHYVDIHDQEVIKNYECLGEAT
jgi:hypothetical protein